MGFRDMFSLVLKSRYVSVFSLAPHFQKSGLLLRDKLLRILGKPSPLLNVYTRCGHLILVP